MDKNQEEALKQVQEFNKKMEPSGIWVCVNWVNNYALPLFIILALLGMGGAVIYKNAAQNICQTACLNWTHSTGLAFEPDGSCYCYNPYICQLPLNTTPFTQFNNTKGG